MRMKWSHNAIESLREGDKEGNQLFGECRPAKGSWAGWGTAEPQGLGLSQGCLHPLSCHWPWRGSQIVVSYVIPFAPCFLIENTFILRIFIYDYIKAGEFVLLLSRWGETTMGKLEEKLAKVAEGGGCAMKRPRLNAADLLGLHLDLGLQPR